jgi:hypothetical protein
MHRSGNSRLGQLLDTGIIPAGLRDLQFVETPRDIVDSVFSSFINIILCTLTTPSLVLMLLLHLQ